MGEPEPLDHVRRARSRWRANVADELRALAAERGGRFARRRKKAGAGAAGDGEGEGDGGGWGGGGGSAAGSGPGSNSGVAGEREGFRGEARSVAVGLSAMGKHRAAPKCSVGLRHGRMRVAGVIRS